MKVYIDFDRTMFNSDAFLDDLEDILISFNISPNLFYEYAKKIQNNGFNPYNVLRLMEKEVTFSQNIYDKIDNLIYNDEKYLYDDVKYFLTYLQEKNYTLILLTRGNKDYQTMKIKYTNILSYFNDFMVTLKHKGELGLNYEESIFIDDNPKEIESILKRKPKLLIRIKRKKALYNSLDIKNNKIVVTSFKEVIDQKIL